VNENGWTALHIAALAEYGYVDCVKYCLEVHANVNVCDNSGVTPLHKASIVAMLKLSVFCWMWE
jgi:ankyrin repeat protein